MKTLADTLPYTLNGICAREVARHWLAKNANFRGISRHSQVHYCLERLFDRSIEESRRQNDSNDEFKDRLIFASNLACTLRNNIWSSKDLDLNYTSLDKFSENDRKNYASYIENIWFRHNPKLAYEEGHRSHHHIDFSVPDVEHTFTDYLNTNWITDLYIEYAILDALISREICICGQEVKLYLDPLSGLIKDSPTFVNLMHGGNLEKNRKKFSSESIQASAARFFLFVAGLSGLIFAYQAIFDSPIRYVIVAVSIALILFALFTAALSFESKQTILRQQTETEKWRRLQRKMFAVWESLAGPVVSPTRVKQCMIAAGAEGAVWNNICWVLIDRAIARDPQAWFVEPTREGWL